MKTPEPTDAQILAERCRTCGAGCGETCRSGASWVYQRGPHVARVDVARARAELEAKAPGRLGHWDKTGGIR